MSSQDIPPAGCDPDAIKLFVGNIPKTYTESQLLPLFSSVGKVVDLIVVRDRATHQSKGSAFVWYKTRALAEEAIQRLHKRHLLPDASGKQKQPMAVREASIQPAKQHSLDGSSRLHGDPLPMYWQQQQEHFCYADFCRSQSGPLQDPSLASSAILTEALQQQQQSLMAMGARLQGAMPDGTASQLYQMPIMQGSSTLMRSGSESLGPSTHMPDLDRSFMSQGNALPGTSNSSDKSATQLAAWWHQVNRGARQQFPVQHGPDRTSMDRTSHCLLSTQGSMEHGSDLLSKQGSMDRLGSQLSTQGSMERGSGHFNSAPMLDQGNSRVLSNQGSMDRDRVSGYFSSVTPLDRGSYQDSADKLNGQLGTAALLGRDASALMSARNSTEGEQSMSGTESSASKGNVLGGSRSRTWSSGLDRVGGHETGQEEQLGSHCSSITGSLVVTRGQIPLINDHMHSIQSLSGANVHVRPNAAPGLFTLQITGQDIQVGVAAKLLEMLGFIVKTG